MERGPRNITLTRAGKLLYKRTKNIINLTKATKKELEDLENGLEGNFALGTNSSSGSILLSKRMIEFHKTCPGVNFQIHEGNTYELLELLNSGIIEVAIVRTPFKMDNVKPNIFCENDDARTSLMWAKAGLGIAIIPKSALNLIGSEGLIYKFIDNDNLKTRIGAV